MRKRIPKLATKAVSRLAEYTSPLQLWREPKAQNLSESQAAGVRAVLARMAFLDFPDWHLAVEGDAARAVRIALAIAANNQRRWAIDYVASALLLCANSGDRAAGVALAYLRRRFAVLPNIKLGRI